MRKDKLQIMLKTFKHVRSFKYNVTSWQIVANYAILFFTYVIRAR